MEEEWALQTRRQDKGRLGNSNRVDAPVGEDGRQWRHWQAPSRGADGDTVRRRPGITKKGGVPTASRETPIGEPVGDGWRYTTGGAPKTMSRRRSRRYDGGGMAQDSGTPPEDDRKQIGEGIRHSECCSYTCSCFYKCERVRGVTQSTALSEW